jgi:hypothetical protein
MTFAKLPRRLSVKRDNPKQLFLFISRAARVRTIAKVIEVAAARVDNRLPVSGSTKFAKFIAVVAGVGRQLSAFVIRRTCNPDVPRAPGNLHTCDAAANRRATMVEGNGALITCSSVNCFGV